MIYLRTVILKFGGANVGFTALKRAKPKMKLPLCQMFKNLPDISPNRLAVKVKSSVEKIIRSGHPWVFEKGIVKLNAEGNAGDLAIIFDQKKNRFLAAGLYDPTSPIRIKILSNQPAQINKDWFSQKIETAFAKRLPLFKTDTNSYRFIYGENDGLPGLIADVYDKVLVVKLYSPIWLPYLKIIFPKLLEISKSEVLILRLSRNLQKAPEQLHGLSDGQVLFGKLENENVIFREHGLQFEANVIHGHKTGYFLDHRHNRFKIRSLSKDKTVLDIFAYAGGFSVNALAGGAKSVTSLDISAPALKLAKRNAALNNLTAKHQLLVGDAFEKMAFLKKEKKRFEVVIVDPPSFAKKESEVAGAMRSYERLTRLAIDLVQPNGILMMASCSSRILADDFFQLVITVLKKSGRNFQEIERTLHDVDHPIGFAEGAYLKSVYFKL